MRRAVFGHSETADTKYISTTQVFQQYAITASIVLLKIKAQPIRFGETLDNASTAITGNGPHYTLYYF